MDQVTASIETIHEGQYCLLTTRYLSECGCVWVVDMWGNVRRVTICPRDTNRDWPMDTDDQKLGEAMARASTK